MTFAVTSIYAALLALLMIALSTRVSMMRGAKDISLGDGGDADM